MASLDRIDCNAKYTDTLNFIAQLLGNVNCCLAGWEMWFSVLEFQGIHYLPY